MMAENVGYRQGSDSKIIGHLSSVDEIYFIVLKLRKSPFKEFRTIIPAEIKAPIPNAMKNSAPNNILHVVIYHSFNYCRQFSYLI